jgi:hypothetical protein
MPSGEEIWLKECCVCRLISDSLIAPWNFTL